MGFERENRCFPFVYLLPQELFEFLPFTYKRKVGAEVAGIRPQGVGQEHNDRLKPPRLDSYRQRELSPSLLLKRIHPLGNVLPIKEPEIRCTRAGRVCKINSPRKLPVGRTEGGIGLHYHQIVYLWLDSEVA